jgi:hypothetical protein
MRIRAAMALALSLAPYYPEPNFMMLLPAQHIFSLIHYTDRSAGRDEATESRRFINSARQLDVIRPESSWFVAIPSLVTEIPDRFRSVKAESIQLTSKQQLFQKGTLKAFKGLRQSHLFRKRWGEQIALLLPSGGADYFTKSGYCSAILAAFDVEIFASLPVWGRHSGAKFEAILRRHQKLREEAFEVLENPRADLEGVATRVADHFLTVCAGLDRMTLNRSFVGFIQIAVEAQANLRQIGVAEGLLGQIRRAARWSGSAFATTLLEWAERLDRR